MQEGTDRRLIILAVFALLAIGVVAAILIGRGGGSSDSTATTASADGCKEVEQPQPKHVSLKAPQADGEEGRKADRGRRDQLRQLRYRARHEPGAEDGQLLRLPGRRRLLRRPHLPPHRSRLRDPGRRSARHRHRRPRLHGRREAAGQPRLHQRHGGDGEDLGGARRAAPAASSTSSPPPMPGCRPNTRWSARSARATTSSNGSTSSARRRKRRSRPVLIEKMTIEKG